MRGKRSAMTLAVLVGAMWVVAAAPAGATITVTRNAQDVATAIGAPTIPNVPALFDLIPVQNPEPPPSYDPVAVSTTPLPPFPFGGTGQSYAILSTGDASLVDTDDPDFFASADNHEIDLTEENPPRGNTAHDATVVRIPVNVGSETGLNCLSFDFRFLSEEYPDFIGEEFNDAFIAELLPRGGVSTWSTDGSEITGLQNDFALDPNGNPVTINSTGPTSMSPVEAAGTPFGGATAPLRAQVPVVQGNSYDLILSIFDQGDQAYDTAALVDDLLLRNAPTGTCTSGSTGLGPVVAITGPANGGTVNTSTPTLSGTTNGSTSTVTVRIYSGDVAIGDPVQTLSAARSGTSWSVVTGALDPGTYTAQASQSTGTNGINGISGPVTFTVVPAQSQPPAGGGSTPQGGSSRQAQVGDRDGDGIPDDQDTSDGSLPPVPGKSVDVRVVSGEVFIKIPGGGRGARATGPGKGFVPLKGAANIPVGSQLDTSKGRVALTSAADTGGAKTQTSDFYDGIFQVKQTLPKKKPKKPAPLITDLVIKGAPRSQCAPLKGGARAAAKKKGPKGVLGSLWGNGKGKFRTNGKYSSATVRGTVWLTQDECDGTLTKVQRGVVQVRDFKRNKTITVKAGHSYLARALRASAKGKHR